jgi:hypothetical protein
METNRPFEWGSFDSWMNTFQAMAPDDFTIEDYRITYDSEKPQGFSRETMKFKPSEAKRRRDQARAQELMEKDQLRSKNGDVELPVPNLIEANEHQRMLFTAELTQALMKFDSSGSAGQTSLAKMIEEAAHAAGIALH